MTANDIRKKFLDFFASKGHKIITSDSLVPKNDPTVLFTTAGMQQFKLQFLGQIEGYTKASTSQKCLRTDDLDKVGKTAFHHTFFEMLGNFSFGDYFKKEAIAWAWEFLTEELKIPKSKLWVSVYKDDKEAEDIWLNTINIPAERFVRLGDKSNFWPSDAKEKGPNGPCGPCSEIFFDYGVNPNCPNGDNCDPDCSCGRFSEVWNLVFTQFNRKEGGILEPLPNKNIDTGMGFERLVAVIQGKKSNYETDVFAPILQAIDTLIPVKLTQMQRFIIADHIRAICFGICDGVIPSNDGRGYIMKKLIVTISEIVAYQGNFKPVIYKLIPSVIESFKVAYPELIMNETRIVEFIESTEKNHLKLREKKLPELVGQISSAKNIEDREKRVSFLGKLMFEYRDTHGLGLEVIQTQLQLSQIPNNEEKDAQIIYDQLMEEQKNRSRASSKMTGDVFTNMDMKLDVQKTEFVGYDQFESRSKILKLFVNNAEVSSIKKGDTANIILDKTPFYAESGGQVGDTGTFSNTNGKLTIDATQKTSNVFIHSATVTEGSFNIGDTVDAKINKERRLAIMRNHTATHLLQAALRKTLGEHVEQQGSLVAEDRLRFDFTHPKAVSKEQLVAIESLIKNYIDADNIVEKKVMPIQEAKKIGALAFFAEKYGETVRVVTIDGYSKEFCGGTHLDHTNEIETFKITSEGAVAQGIRRIEARTSHAAVLFIAEQKEKEAEQIELQNKRLEEQKNKKEMDRTALESFKKERLNDLIENALSIKNTKVITFTFPNSDANLLKQMSEEIKQKVPSVISCSGSTLSIGSSIVVNVSKDLVQKGIRANDLIKSIAPLINGNGGGSAETAQAGNKEAIDIDVAVERAKTILTKALTQ